MNKTKLPHRFVRGLHLLVIAVLLAGLALGLSPVRVAQAATFTVNDTGDDGDNNPGDGTCATAGGVCTLRAAIEEECVGRRRHHQLQRDGHHHPGRHSAHHQQ